MSILDHRPPVRPPSVDLDEFEDAFRAWVHDPVKPDVVDVGEGRDVPMIELSRRLAGSSSTLPAAACAQIGLPSGVTIATAVDELLHATVDPEGPRCRSFRAASYYLRGLARLDADLQPVNGDLRFRTERTGGHLDVG